jgi:reverse gyrase
MTKSKNKTYWKHGGIKMSVTSKKLKKGLTCNICKAKPTKLNIAKLKRELKKNKKIRLVEKICGSLRIK